MSMFYCAECDLLRDSDDGCEVAANRADLVCAECVAEAEEAEDRRRANPLEPDFRRAG